MKLTAEDPEHGLVDRARSGDARARAALVEQHYPAAHSLAFKLTGSPETSRDVVQEAFLRAFARIDQHHAEYSFASWLFKIVANQARDLFRREARGEARELAPDPEPGADAILQKSEEAARVRAALETLPVHTRLPLILHLQEGLPIREIAYATETSENSVRMKIYRGLLRVRALLREEP
jgi:RNA polymerase sigma-70 factor (ECF subfamily)